MELDLPLIALVAIIVVGLAVVVIGSKRGKEKRREASKDYVFIPPELRPPRKIDRDDAGQWLGDLRTKEDFEKALEIARSYPPERWTPPELGEEFIAKLEEALTRF